MSLLKVNEVQNYNGSSLTLTASTVSTSAQLNTGGNVSVTGSINVSDDSTTRSNLGLGTMATQNANTVAITGGTINTVQPATGQSLTIKDEDGNTAITIGTDNTATGYLSLNFGSYHGDSGGAGSGTLSGNTLDDYEVGSFSFAVRGTSGTGYYTKIGRLVNIQMYFNGTAGTTPDNSISLPFQNDGPEIRVGSNMNPSVSGGSDGYFLISSSASSGTIFNPTVSNSASVYFGLTFSYYTS